MERWSAVCKVFILLLSEIQLNNEYMQLTFGKEEVEEERFIQLFVFHIK